MVVAFTAASFLGAFLLFQLEPMMAKMLLPSLGGSAAVWNTAMVFFQVALVLGYALAHVSLRRLRPAWHVALQLTLLLAVVLTLPVALPATWEPPVGGDPVWWTLLACLVIGGAPFVALATTGPTMQRWFSYTTHPRAEDPYFLYAAGNAGSLLALLSYPLVVEPNLALSAQSRLWGARSLHSCCSRSAARSPCSGTDDPARCASGPASVGEASDPCRPVDSSGGSRWQRSRPPCCSASHGHLATDIAVDAVAVGGSARALPESRSSSRSDGTLHRMTGRSARALRLLAIPLALTFIGIVPVPVDPVADPARGRSVAAALVAHARLAQDRPPAVAPHPVLPSASPLVAPRGGSSPGLIAPVVFTTVPRISDRVRPGPFRSSRPRWLGIGCRPGWPAAGLALCLSVWSRSRWSRSAATGHSGRSTHRDGRGRMRPARCLRAARPVRSASPPRSASILLRSRSCPGKPDAVRRSNVLRGAPRLRRRTGAVTSF